MKTDTREWVDDEEGIVDEAMASQEAATKQWHDNFDESQQQLIQDCREYAYGNPVRIMKVYHLAEVIAKFAFILDTAEELIIDLARMPKQPVPWPWLLQVEGKHLVETFARIIAPREDAEIAVMEGDE